MSKFGKIFLIICFCCLILGSILYGAGIVLGGSSYFYYSLKDGFIDAGNWEERVSETAELPSFDKIDIRVDYSDIVITEGDSFSVEYKEILYGNDESEQNYWKVENGCFTCDRKKGSGKRGVVGVNLGFNWFGLDNFGWYPSDNYIHLTVPRGTELTGVKVESSFGDISLSKLMVRENIEIYTKSGDIKVDTVSASELKTNNSFGEMKILGTDLDTVHIELQSGDLELSNSSLGDLYLKNEFGSVKITDCNSATGDFLIGSADLSAVSFNVEKEFTIEGKFGDLNFTDCSMEYGGWNTENGDINAKNLAVKNKLEAKTKFGEISLKMKDGLAPYRYECYTHFGEVSVGRDNKGGKENGGSGTVPLILESENGDIELE